MELKGAPAEPLNPSDQLVVHFYNAGGAKEATGGGGGQLANPEEASLYSSQPAEIKLIKGVVQGLTWKGDNFLIDLEKAGGQVVARIGIKFAKKLDASTKSKWKPLPTDSSGLEFLFADCEPIKLNQGFKQATVNILNPNTQAKMGVLKYSLTQQGTDASN